MAFHWDIPESDLTDDDRADLGADSTFGSREDAEAWLSGVWGDLSAAGVESVTLMDDDAVVYTMSLEA